ncbi:ABC transporter permease [Thermomicrobium sp. CFH 73360]|uniref:ABC transporter permease n=1 Tax=Thermomicrobium sp. CFH 73360 TaxID=2951987 RepID=UPI002076B471|nr:ABC transporter permease [Thermomicrobium sp. CFH 73360]MCM8745132.1 ABC transporter permease [Thermomicrobium sp. CFH 73360]
MTQYLIRRILISIPTLVAISIVIFTILALAPGDPLAEFAMNPAVPPEVRQRIRKSMGLDDPIPVRYVKWASSMLRGDFGYSFRSKSPVIDLIRQRLPTTLYVIGTAYLVSVLIAIPVGVLSAIRQYSIFDNVATTLAFIGFSLPTFVTGILFILLFSVKLGWLPMIYRTTIETEGLAGLWERVKQALMPIMVLGLFETAALTRYTRAAMLETIHQDYVRTARAKGLAERVVILRHAMRNALIPVVTIVALSIPGIFTGAVITEQIFRVPGMGSLLISAIRDNDTPVIMAITIIFSALVVLFNLIADILYGVLDPRIKYE